MGATSEGLAGAASGLGDWNVRHLDPDQDTVVQRSLVRVDSVASNHADSSAHRRNLVGLTPMGAIPRQPARRDGLGGANQEELMTIARGFPEMCRDNTAMVIIDMQKDFLDEGGACFLPGGRSVVPAITSLLTDFRNAGIPVIHVSTVWQRDGAGMSRFTTSDVLRERGLRLGEQGAMTIAEVTPLPTEYTVRKIRYSAFFGTELESLLRALGTVYMVTVGVATNFCVRSTVHDAAFRDFLPVVVSDCTTSYTRAEHLQSLRDIEAGFGLVKDSDGLRQLLNLASADSRATVLD